MTVLDDAPTSTKAARGKPIGTFGALPLYKTGDAPAHLRTRSQLERGLRLRPTGAPVCYVKPTWHPDERRALYDPADTAAIPFRSAGHAWAWWARRTCPRCGQRREYVVHGTQCGACHRADRARLEEVQRRTCSECRRVGSKPLPLVKIGFYPEKLCRFCVAQKKAEKERLLRAAIRCPGGCGKRTATKREVLAWALKHYRAISRWERRCPPCEQAHQAEEERAEAERQERWEKARAEQAERDRAAREARENELAALRAWARDALTDPDTVFLDTETTGLSDDARIVDIAVTTAAGEVLLDTLVNPGEPIPAEATQIHGITDAMVADAPTFADLAPRLEKTLRGKRVIIYNAQYDMARLAHEFSLLCDSEAEAAAVAEAVYVGTTGINSEDAMVPYSDWYGDWSEYWGNYSWQPLGGGHRALGDCLAVIDCLKAMARDTRADDEEQAA